MKNKPNTPKQIVNRRAKHDYQLDDSLVVGLELTGAEVKALRMGHGHLRGSYVTVKDNQLWLLNATITGSNCAPLTDEQKVRTRKLLANRKEIDAFIASKQQGRSIVPLKLLTGGRYIKLRMASGRGKKLHDKRASLKEHAQKRDMDAAIKAKR